MLISKKPATKPALLLLEGNITLRWPAAGGNVFRNIIGATKVLPRPLTSMRRIIFQTLLAIALFAAGVVLGTVWHARRVRSTSPTPSSTIALRPDDKPWPLSPQVVARSLQSHSFRTDKLRLNSNDEVVWRWLKESVANYPQNSVKLDISVQHSYGVVLYPPKVLEPTELTHCNRELAAKGLSPLTAGKIYIPVQVNIDNIICPDWHGFIDADQAKLVYVEGLSG